MSFKDASRSGTLEEEVDVHTVNSEESGCISVCHALTKI